MVTYADLKYSIPDFSAYFVAILHGACRIHPIKGQILHAGLLWVNIADEEYWSQGSIFFSKNRFFSKTQY